MPSIIIRAIESFKKSPPYTSHAQLHPAFVFSKDSTIYKGVNLVSFTVENFTIEGIDLDKVKSEMHAGHLAKFLRAPLTLNSLIKYQKTIAPDHPLRTEAGMDVRVGEHIALKGSPFIQRILEEHIGSIHEQTQNPCEKHQRFQYIHPFMDGNGRTGRALWLWQMLNQKKWGKVVGNSFLLTYYYQTLQEADGRM